MSVKYYGLFILFTIFAVFTALIGSDKSLALVLALEFLFVLCAIADEIKGRYTL